MSATQNIEYIGQAIALVVMTTDFDTIPEQLNCLIALSELKSKLEATKWLSAQ
jgi:hypothetical protein